MEEIIKKIEKEYKNTKPYSYEIDETSNDLANPDFLENLLSSAIFAYINNDFNFCNKLLGLLTSIPYEGDSRIFTWVEKGLALKMYLFLNENNRVEYEKTKKIVLNKFNFEGLKESTRKINLKAFTRRLSGSSLPSVQTKIARYKEANDLELEFMYSVSYYSELIFIYSMNEGNVSDDIKGELEYTKKRLLEIIEYYKNNL